MLDLGNLISGIAGAVQTGYNLYTNKRDFNYQKDLQQTMFQREDNAVQRRMADLEAAGLNPNLAAGSAAGAGAVVSRSNTNDVNFGAAIDFLKSSGQIAAQKQETENKKVENNILKDQASIINMEKQTKLAETMYNLGLPIKVDTKNDGYNFTFKVGLDDKDIGQYTWNTERPLIQQMEENLKYLINNNDYLSKELKWQTTKNVVNAISSFSGFIPKLSFNGKIK